MDDKRSIHIFITYISLKMLYVSTTEVLYNHDFKSSIARRCKY